MEESISAPVNDGHLGPPSRVPDDMEVLTARARESASAISQQTQEVAIRVAALTESEKQMAGILADIRAKQAEVATVATAAAKAKADLESRMGTVTAQAARIEEAHKHADQIRGELDKALTSATQHATGAEGFRATSQSASEAATTALTALQAIKGSAKGEVLMQLAQI